MLDPDLPACPPGPRLAQLLASTDVATLGPDECLAYVSAARRQQSWTDSVLLAAAARFAEVRDGDAAGERVRPGGAGTPPCAPHAPDELAPELRAPSPVAQRLIADALDLTHRLRRVGAALRVGLVDTARARMIAQRTRELSAEASADVETAILDRLGRLTHRQLQVAVDRAAARAEPGSATLATVARAADRRVDIDPTTDDHAEVYGLLSVADGQRLEARLDEIADLLAAETPDRGRDRHRARALGLLADPAAVTELANRSSDRDDTEPTLPSTTLYVHLRPDQTFDLEGYGILTLPTVADLLADSDVTVQPVIDPMGAEFSDAAEPSDSRLRDSVILTHSTCVFPYCHVDARRCRTDQAIGAPPDPSGDGGLGPLCERHHRVQAHGDWRVRRPFRGVFVWLSPTGRAYTVDRRGTQVLAA